MYGRSVPYRYINVVHVKYAWNTSMNAMQTPSPVTDALASACGAAFVQNSAAHISSTVEKLAVLPHRLVGIARDGGLRDAPVHVLLSMDRRFWKLTRDVPIAIGSAT
jgi:hypothetical protein